MKLHPNDIRVDVVADKPKGGMWHTGPNPSWVTVTYIPTMTQARCYHDMQNKARDLAMACVELMVKDVGGGTACSFPEAIRPTETKP
jgi:protein subunit release factor A